MPQVEMQASEREPPPRRLSHFRDMKKRLSPSKRGYDRQWQKFRRWYLARWPLCRHCQAAGKLTSATEVDHVKRMSEGGEQYELDNLQPLCKPCHSAKTATEERGSIIKGCDLDGLPIDPNHPWNR